MRTIEEVFSAGEEKRFVVPGRYFRILSNPGGTLDVQFLNGNQASAEAALGVGSGYYAVPVKGFETLMIKSAAAQTIKIAISMGEGGYDIPPSGNVTITNTPTVNVAGLPASNGALTDTQKSVTNADQIIVDANAARRFLMIQNNSAAGVLRITLDGSAASATKGKRIQPGGFLLLDVYAPTGDIHGFMETADATANNVEISEG